MKKLLFILIVLSFHFLCYSREIDFDYEYHNYESYNINEKIKVTNKTKENVDFSIYGRLYSRSNDSFCKIIDVSATTKTKNTFFAIEENDIKKGKYEFLKSYNQKLWIG